MRVAPHVELLSSMPSFALATIGETCRSGMCRTPGCWSGSQSRLALAKRWNCGIEAGARPARSSGAPSRALACGHTRRSSCPACSRIPVSVEVAVDRSMTCPTHRSGSGSEGGLTSSDNVRTLSYPRGFTVVWPHAPIEFYRDGNCFLAVPVRRAPGYWSCARSCRSSASVPATRLSRSTGQSALSGAS